MDLLQFIGSLGGTTGVMGYLIFLAYKRAVSQIREDRIASQEQMREDRKFMEDRLTGIIEADQATREKHTQVLTELTTLLLRLNGRLK